MVMRTVCIMKSKEHVPMKNVRKDDIWYFSDKPDEIWLAVEDAKLIGDCYGVLSDKYKKGE